MDQIYYCCYKATNKVNGKLYIGFASNPAQRWREHKRCADKGLGFAFHAAIRKHGWENFEFEVVCCGKNKREMLEFVEPALIEQYQSSIDQNGYNILRRPVLSPLTKKKHKSRRGKKNHFFGKQHTAEAKQLMSEAKKGKISPRKGKTHSEKAKLKMSVSHTGHVHTDEQKAKIGLAHCGRHMSEESKQKMRIVAANRPKEHYIRKIQCAKNMAKAAGLQFFEDKPCRVCSNTRRYTTNGTCVSCKLEKGRLRYSRRKERINSN